MPTKSNTQDSLAFAFEILNRLDSKTLKTAQQLQNELNNAGFDKTERTLQRQLKSLSERNFIECDERSKPFGYRLIQNDVLALGKFTEKEALLLALAQNHLKAFLPATTTQGLRGLFEHLNVYWMRSLGDDKAQKAKQWTEKIRFVPEVQQLQTPNPEDSVLTEITEALYHDRYLTVHYKNFKSVQGGVDSSEKAPEVKVHQRLMPLGLVQQGNRLYLVCRFNGYDNERNIALHRVVKAKVESETFERPKGFDLEQYDASGSFGFGSGQCQLRFCMSQQQSALLKETPLSDDQAITAQPANENRPEHCEITATVVDSILLDRWLYGFGDAVWHVRKTPLDEV